MGLFDFIFKKKTEKKQELQPQVTITFHDEEAQQQEKLAFHEEEYRKALKLYDEAHADKEYQDKLTQYYEFLTQIQETYSVINNIGSFCGEEGEKLIENCALAMGIEENIREKRQYYEDRVLDMSPPCKTLAMVFEKRGDYQTAATICAYAIENGYVSDGTKSGMRGRLARMIKKGNLPLTDNLKELLNL